MEEKQQEKEKKKLSVKIRIVALMFVCWLVPMIIMTVTNIYYLYSNRFESKIEEEVEQLKFDNESSGRVISQLIQESRNASYDMELVDLYDRFEDGRIPDHDLISKSSYYLYSHYNRNTSLKMALLWYSEDPEKLNASTYNTGGGFKYSTVSEYWEKDHKKILELSRDLNTKVCFLNLENRIYMIRNLYNTEYENIGTLVFLINERQCFKDYEAMPTEMSVTLYIDDCKIQLAGSEVTREEVEMDNIKQNQGATWKNGRLRTFNKMRVGEHVLTTFVRYDDSSAFSLFHGFKAIYIGMVLCIFPLIAILLVVFYRHVNKPIQMLMEASHEIEQGHLGYHMEYEPQSSEFLYLTQSFNNMSDRLKFQFDHIYEEEIALRDARIMALQAHINPHFMNNTLEIINWEARLSGNEKVSHMIEALSVLMDAGIDRKKRPEVPLEEEMKYVNAYLYITCERLGSRLTIKNEIPSSIMKYKVPRLILQPVIENAIEHGVVINGRGTVTMTGFVEGDFLYLDIINDGSMTEEDKAKVARLLDFNYDTSKESSGNMGIANVNQRLRILYGEPCGLTVDAMDEEHIRARLAISLKPREESAEK